MLEGVRDEDIAAASEALERMVEALRGFAEGLGGRRHGWRRWLGRAGSSRDWVRRLPELRRRIDGLCDELERRQTSLLTDVAALDRLHAAQLEQVEELERHVCAAEAALRELDDVRLPECERSGGQSGTLEAGQRLRTLRSARDDLERRLRDLQLSRAVAEQNLAAIRIVQENDRALVERIDATLAQTLPLWRQQLALALAVQRGAVDLESASRVTGNLLAEVERSRDLADRDRRSRAEAALRLASD